ncbi:MAG: hypothetical protein ACK59J_04815, partial [Pseudanabaena sp.]
FFLYKKIFFLVQPQTNFVGGGATPPTSLIGFCVASNARITALCLRSNPKGGALRLLLGFVQEQLTRLPIIEI